MVDIRERVHFVAFCGAVAVTMAGLIFWLFALIGQAVLFVGDVEMETRPIDMAAIGSVLYLIGGLAAWKLGGKWDEIRCIQRANK